MSILTKLFEKKDSFRDIVSVCFLSQGLGIAIAKYNTENTLQLAFSEFFPETNIEAQEKILRQLAGSYQLTECDTYLLLESRDYRHLSIEAPVVEDHEMKAALRWKVTDLVDFSVEDACLDFYRLPDAKHTNSKKMLR